MHNWGKPKCPRMFTLPMQSTVWRTPSINHLSGSGREAKKYVCPKSLYVLRKHWGQQPIESPDSSLKSPVQSKKIHDGTIWGNRIRACFIFWCFSFKQLLRRERIFCRLEQNSPKLPTYCVNLWHCTPQKKKKVLWLSLKINQKEFQSKSIYSMMKIPKQWPRQ